MATLRATMIGAGPLDETSVEFQRAPTPPFFMFSGSKTPGFNFLSRKFKYCCGIFRGLSVKKA